MVFLSRYGCPLHGCAQGQVGWGFEQPGLVESVPAHGRGVGTRWPVRSLLTQTILWFCDTSNGKERPVWVCSMATPLPGVCGGERGCFPSPGHGEML